MTIQVYRTPQRRDDTVTVSKSGEALTINGMEYDLSGVNDPVTIDTPYIIGPVFRLDGTVRVMVLQSYGMGEEPPRADEMPSAPQPEITLTPLTARQLRLGLVRNGFSLEEVKATIDAIEDEQDRAVAQIEWEYASQFERDHPLLSRVGAALNLTPPQIDEMWQHAVAL